MKKIAVFVFLLVSLSATGLHAADIAFDNTTSTFASATSLNFNHAIGSGSDRLLTVCVSAEAQTGNSQTTVAPTGVGQVTFQVSGMGKELKLM